MPLRLVFSAPPASAGSRTSTASLASASASISAREVRLPVSSSEVMSIATEPLDGGAVSNTRARRQQAHRHAHLHVEHAGAVEPAVAADDRHRGDLSVRPDGVDVADQQDARPTDADLEQRVIAGIGPGLDPRPDADRPGPGPQLGAAAVHRRLVVGRRLDGDQRLGEVEEPRLVRAAERFQGMGHRAGPARRRGRPRVAIL